MNNENEETPRTRIPRGHGPGASFEKPKNFKEALLKLKKYLSKLMSLIIVAVLLSMISSVLSIIGPNKIKDLTNEIQGGIVINKDNSITVKDDGRGIPTEIHPKTKISTVETVYTVLHAGGKFGGGGYKVSGGLHGVGASVVNALSKWLEVTVYKNGKIHFIRFENGGHTVEPLKVIGTCNENRTGTTVTFKPDPEIFDTDIYSYETLKVRVRELAFLNKGLSLNLRDDRDLEDTTGETFCYEGGISEYVRFINKDKTVLHENIIHLEGEEDDVQFEVAMQYNDGYSFVNNINTHDGGTHEEGVRRALTRIINSYARKTNMLKEKDESLTGDDVKEGLTMIISCKHPNPQFEGQTKGRLGNSEVRKLADSVFSKGFERFLMENPDEAKIIINKALLANRARNAARKARIITLVITKSN